MKRFFVSAVILCSLTVAAFAAKNSENLNVSRTMVIGTTKVAQGEYKVSWAGSDANLQLTITKNGKTVATAPAKMVQEKSGAVGVTTNTVNGAEVVDTILFRNFKFVIASPATTGE